MWARRATPGGTCPPHHLLPPSERMPRLEEMSSPRTKAKLSKWSKVKEVLKWERSPSEPRLGDLGYSMGMPPREEEYTEVKQKFQAMMTSSSSSEELPSDIYNFDDHPLEICIHRRCWLISSPSPSPSPSPL